MSGPEAAIEERVVAWLATREEELVSLEKFALWNVGRAVIRSADGAISTVIVKWLRASVASDLAVEFLRTECAALSLVGGLEPSIAPALLGATTELAVTEDLGDARLLWEMLRDGDPLSPAAYRAFAGTMARLHTSTVGAMDLWDRARQQSGLGPTTASPERIDHVPWEWDLRSVTPVGHAPSAAAQRDLEHVRSLLLDPGPFLAFSNGDPGANNFMVTADGGRVIDFEYARFRHALIDAACLHVQHSVWMTIGSSARYGVVEVYRAGLAEQIPEAEDDELFGTAMAGAAAMRATERLRRFALLDARPEGHESRKQMIATTDAAAETIAEYGFLKDLGGWLTDVSLALRRRWPDADISFPDAFTVR